MSTERCPQRERYFWMVLIIIAVGAYPVNETMRYFAVQSIKDNTDDNFKVRAAEHLASEKRQNRMIDNQIILQQNDQIVYNKMVEVEKKLDLLLNVSK